MKILCITTGQYPHDDASSQRLHMLSCMLTDMGHEVLVLCRNKSCTSGKNDNVKFKSVFSSPRTFLGKALDVNCVFQQAVKHQVALFKPDAVLLIRSSTITAQWLIRNSDVYGFKFLYDAVEWYSKEEFKYPFLSIEYIKKEFWMRRLFSKNTGIIAISKYLEDHFLKRGNRCIRIPSVCDSKKLFCNVSKIGDKLNIVYAGTPGKKDRFKEVIGALSELESSERSRLRIRIIGATRLQIAENAEISLRALSALDECMEYYGVMQRENVFKLLSESEFSILIRPDKARYANAGFPTKITESMAAGATPICNLTSDLGEYLNDSNSIIVTDCSTSAVLESFRKILSLSKEQIIKMKLNSRNTAERFFDYRIFKERLESFIRSI